MQSCAAKSVSTSLIPGKILSKNSLGFRETSSKISLEEVDPYTVRVRRNICKTELVSVDHQALLETRYGTQTLDCTDAYPAYFAHNITALGVPLLYDSVTGFNLLREKCKKNPPVYRIVTTESTEIVKEEAYDSNTTVCEPLPVADALLTAKINDAVISITTSADGIASLPPEKVAQLVRAAVNASIQFKYESIELTTRHLRKKPEFPLLFSIAAKNNPGDDNLTNQWGESGPATLSDPETAQGTNFVAALAVPPVIAPVPPVEADTGEKTPVKIDREGAGGASPPLAVAPQAVGTAPARSAGAGTTAAVPEKTAGAETPVLAKVDPKGSGGISAPATVPLSAAVPLHPREMLVVDVETAPAREKTAAAETAAPAKIDKESSSNNSSPKTVSAAASNPLASKPLPDEIRSAVPAVAPHKTRPPVMARSAPKRLVSTAEILFQHTLFLGPELQRLCCPLTETLFWNIGY